MRRPDSNERPPGYEPGELPTAPLRDVNIKPQSRCFLEIGCKGIKKKQHYKVSADRKLKEMSYLKIINRISLLFLVILISGNVFSQKTNSSALHITYTKADSIKVVELLKDGLNRFSKLGSKAEKKQLMLFYGHKLIGVPYVPATLEVNKMEHLVVNIHQLDCTTFVETVFALVLTTVQHSIKWNDYCTNLERIRYEGGVMNGYASRNHYFLWWVESNKKQGLVSTPMDDFYKSNCNPKATVCKPQIISIDWMTKHSGAYPMLRGNTLALKEISRHEKASKGTKMMYIPHHNLGLSKKKMQWVNNGDILAICTNKKGLDTTHLGIAEWGSDGKLHLLNASQIHKKVVLESMTLKEYMHHHPSQLGVWVVSPCF